MSLLPDSGDSVTFLMKRGTLITLLGGGAPAWAAAATAQHVTEIRKIGVLESQTAAAAQGRENAFWQTLATLGWTEGENAQ